MTEDTYTHVPGTVEGEREDPESDDAAGDPREQVEDSEEPVADPGEPVERGREEWNWRDWVLVGVIVLCFLVIPGTILYLPPVEPFRFAYLVLPLIPAILLGAVAVWSAQRST